MYILIFVLQTLQIVVNKVIFKHSLHKRHVNEYQMLILLNEYLNKSNICCSPIRNYHKHFLVSLFVTTSLSFHTDKFFEAQHINICQMPSSFMKLYHSICFTQIHCPLSSKWVTICVKSRHLTP